MDFVKAKTTEAALSSYRTYNNNVPQNLSNDQFIALENLCKIKGLIIQKSDQSNFVVIADRQDYINKMGNILSDQKKFTIVNLKDGALLNFAVKQEKHVDKVLKKLVESTSVTEKTRKSFIPVGSRPGVMYGSCKVHKTSLENCPPFRSFFLVLRTPI